jgi:hypothetical protein
MVQAPMKDVQAQIASLAQSMSTPGNFYGQPPQQQNYCGYNPNGPPLVPTNACQVPQSQPPNPNAKSFYPQQNLQGDLMGFGANDQSSLNFMDNGPPSAIPRRDNHN